MIRVGLDSNVLAYLAGAGRISGDLAKGEAIRQLLSETNSKAQFLAPIQALGELYVVLTRAGAAPDEAGQVVSTYSAEFETLGADQETLSAALDLAVQHRLQFWDSLICATVHRAGCTLMLSEDMQNGFAWRGLIIANPFAATPHAKLRELLA